MESFDFDWLGEGALGEADPDGAEEPGGVCAPPPFGAPDEGLEAGLLKRGGSSPEPEDPLGLESLPGWVLAPGVLAELGAEVGAVADGLCVKRGGCYSLLMPTGTLSVFWDFFGSSIPLGCHEPVPIQGA